MDNRSVHSVIYGHDKSAPTVDARGVNVGVRGYITCSWCKHWLYTVIRSVYSVICGHDKSAPTVGVRGVNVDARGVNVGVRG